MDAPEHMRRHMSSGSSQKAPMRCTLSDGSRTHEAHFSDVDVTKPVYQSAMGTEFNILLMSRYFEERALGLTARTAMSKASLKIGRAIAASGLTVMGGFAVLAVSDFPLLANFGTVTAVNIGVCLLSTLVLLPPLLVWASESQRGEGVIVGSRSTV